MLNYTLGTIEASEALIKDLYIDLRAKVNAWSKITQQTPQARMGYVGQHLVSVVTGYPGGKSGARGYDLVIDDERHGEIKTCYRVDQLGSCNACGAVVSSLETECAVCRSTSINICSEVVIISLHTTIITVDIINRLIDNINCFFEKRGWQTR